MVIMMCDADAVVGFVTDVRAVDAATSCICELHCYGLLMEKKKQKNRSTHSVNFQLLIMNQIPSASPVHDTAMRVRKYRLPT